MKKLIATILIIAIFAVISVIGVYGNEDPTFGIELIFDYDFDGDFGTSGTSNPWAPPPIFIIINNTGNQPTGPLTAAFTHGIAFYAFITEIPSIPAGEQGYTIFFWSIPEFAGVFEDTLTIAAAPDNPNAQFIEPQTFDVVVRTVPSKLVAPWLVNIDGTKLFWINEAYGRAKSFRLYVNGEPSINVSLGFNDLDTLGLAPGNHKIQIRALGDGADILDSDLSNAVDFYVAFVPLTGIYDISGATRIMLVLLVISAGMWGYILRQKFRKAI